MNNSERLDKWLRDHGYASEANMSIEVSKANDPGSAYAFKRSLDVMNAIRREREFQTNKHGPEGHTIGAWLLILEAELEEAKRACIKPGTGRDNVISELIQVAAVAVACLEQYGVDELPGRQV